MATAAAAVTAPHVSERVALALATFGLTTSDPGPFRAPDLDGALDTLRGALAPGTLVLLTGPSGIGKSTLLRRLAGAPGSTSIIRADRVLARALSRPRQRIVDLFCAPPSAPARSAACNSSAVTSLRCLAAAGLADAHTLARRARELSDGQRARLVLALCIDRAHARLRRNRPCLLLVDEFGSGLDDATVRSVAHGLSRWFRRVLDESPGAGLSILCASTRDDLGPSLSPTRRFHLSAGPSLDERPAADAPTAAPSFSFVIGPGTPADHRALASLHYRAGPPATIRRILAARDPRSSELLGVLLTSMPALNAPWRNRFWPGRFTSADPGANARRINDELRCISRVIVDPRHRALGIGSALVRTYLDAPETPLTEAIAAMGAASPIFARAGMTEHVLPPSLRDQRLLDALDHARVRPLDLARGRRILAACARHPWLEVELRRWANRSRATRAQRHGPLAALLPAAARISLPRPRVYAHTRS